MYYQFIQSLSKNGSVPATFNHHRTSWRIINFTVFLDFTSITFSHEKTGGYITGLFTKTEMLLGAEPTWTLLLETSYFKSSPAFFSTLQGRCQSQVKCSEHILFQGYVNTRKSRDDTIMFGFMNEVSMVLDLSILLLNQWQYIIPIWNLRETNNSQLIGLTQSSTCCKCHYCQPLKIPWLSENLQSIPLPFCFYYNKKGGNGLSEWWTIYIQYAYTVGEN